MGLMEPGCTRRDFGRDVQPAVPNRPRCCPWWDPRSERYQTTEADSTQHLLVFLTNNCTSPAELLADAVPDLSRESVPQRVSMVEAGPLSIITCRVCEMDGTLDERLLGDSLRFCYCIDYC